jgi:Na+:H+ antiporter, NhaA family
LLLPVGAAVAFVWANTFEASYLQFAGALAFAVNDVGMVFFFALAAKEVVDATAPDGPLHSWRRAALPLAAAAGGMIAPALLYVALTHASGADALLHGWAIPCATDIAFSYLVAAFIFRGHPAVPFLLLLAIADDAMGLMILAVFYPTGGLHVIRLIGLLIAAVVLAVTLRRTRVRSFWPSIGVGGAVSWAGFLLGGLHPALALVPIVPFLRRNLLAEFEHWWKRPVQVILFFFGLVNAGVPIRAHGAGTWLVLTAVVIGKPLGVVAATAFAVLAGLRMPSRLAWRDVLVVGCAAGIGFTVALFFATAAFPRGELLDQTKLGALLSLGSAGVTLAAAMMLRVGRFRVLPAPHP